MRLFRPLTSFLPPRPFSPSLGLSLLPSIPDVFIDSNLFHLPPVRSSQHHPGLVPIPLGDIRPCCLHLPSFCRSRLLPLSGAACRHLIACLCDGSLPLPAPPRQAHLPKPSCLRLRRRPCLPKPPGPSSVSVRLAPPSSAISGFRRLVSPRSRTSLRLRLPVSVRPCQPRAVRTRGVFTHRDDFGKPACVERGLVRTAMFHGPTDVPRMGAPVMERAGSSGNARIGSHLAATDAAKSHAGQVDGPGSSGNAGNGSHLAEADAADGHAGQVASSGMSGNTENGSHLAEAYAADGLAGHVDGPGSSGNTENGSYLAEADAAEGHAGQVDGPGSSGNAGNGSHLAAADFSDEPRVVMWRHTPPRRTESGLLSYGTASQDSSVQKTALWRTRAHLSAGAARGGGSSAGRRAERAAGASGSWWRIVVAQVRRKSMMARLRQSRCDTKPDSSGGR